VIVTTVEQNHTNCIMRCIYNGTVFFTMLSAWIASGYSNQQHPGCNLALGHCAIVYVYRSLLITLLWHYISV